MDTIKRQKLNRITISIRPHERLIAKLLEHKPSKTAILLALYLFKCSDHAENSTEEISIEELCKEFSLKRTAITDAISDLKEINLLSTEKQFSGKSRFRLNIYGKRPQ